MTATDDFVTIISLTVLAYFAWIVVSPRVVTTDSRLRSRGAAPLVKPSDVTPSTRKRRLVRSIDTGEGTAVTRSVHAPGLDHRHPLPATHVATELDMSFLDKDYQLKNISLPEGSSLYHVNEWRVCSRELALSTFSLTTFKYPTGHIFFWLDRETAQNEGVKPSEMASEQMYIQIANHHRDRRYVSILQSTTRHELKLVDFKACGQKEEFARKLSLKMEVTNRSQTQNPMVAALTTLGYDGWLSAHDASDATLEVCVFGQARCYLPVESGFVYP